MTLLRTLILGLGLLLGASSAHAQNCSGQAVSAAVCGNPNASTGLPSWATQTALLDRAFGTTSGTVLNRGSSVWAETSGPTLGANGGTGGSIILNGATSGSVTIGAKAAAGTATIFNLPITNGSLNNVLITDGSGNTSWTTAGAGTVSSVGLSMPGIFTVSGSPVVGAGTLTATLATETANTVWAGPTTGAASAPTFRALVGADLPNPSASTLGGIESFAAVSSQWIRQISTSGVPTASQPAFTDISGVATGAQLPNPSASTLGGVESLAAVASKWINTISTSGVPSATQPAFTDISGQTTLAQFPAISNNTILSNISGGSATPLADSLTAIIDSAIGSTQGQVLYRSGTVWTALSPGTSGQVLTTAGAAANPSWTTVTGTGTVTNVATGSGLTGGPITTTGTISLATISTGNVLGNVTGSPAAPAATTPTQVLDVIGSTQGSVLYRGASVWTALTPGTNGQFLQTTGAGSTPQWASAVTSVVAGSGLSGGTITNTGTIASYFDPNSVTNCTIVASVSGNALTVALKNQAGSDPSSSSPCTISFRDAVLTTGGYTAVNAVAATSFSTGTSGSTFGSANATPFRLWITAFNSGGTIVLGVSKQSTSTAVLTLDESSFPATGACSACTNAATAGLIYTTGGVSGKAFRIIGYMDWSSGLTTAGTWASGPTKIQNMTMGIKKPGDNFGASCANFAAGSGTTTTSTTFVDTNTTLGITLTSAVNSVAYNVTQETESATSSAEALLTIARGGVAVGPQIIGAFNPGGVGVAASAILGSDFPGSVGPLTYTIRIKTPASTVAYNDTNGGSTICLAEVQN